MDKIKAVSRFCKALFWLGFWVTPAAIILCWLTNGSVFHFQIHSFDNLPSIAQLPTVAKILGFSVTLIPTIVLMLVFYFTARLFNAYQSGKIFEMDNARCIRNIGIVIFVWELVRPIYDLLISYAFSFSTGKPIFQVAFDATTIGEVIIGILLIVIGWIMMEANKLKEEQEFTI